MGTGICDGWSRGRPQPSAARTVVSFPACGSAVSLGAASCVDAHTEGGRRQWCSHGGRSGAQVSDTCGGKPLLLAPCALHRAHSVRGKASRRRVAPVVSPLGTPIAFAWRRLRTFTAQHFPGRGGLSRDCGCSRQTYMAIFRLVDREKGPPRMQHRRRGPRPVELTPHAHPRNGSSLRRER